jgi:ATP-binding cassette subfamily B multidrug efflux pump
MTLIQKTNLPKTSQIQNILRCFGYLRPHWKLTVGGYLMMFLIDGIQIINPQLIRWSIDQGIRAQDLHLLTLFVGALLLLVVVKGVFTYFQGVWTETASQNVAYDLRNALQNKITLLSFAFHDQSETGDLLSRAVQDVDRIRFLTGRATFRIGEGLVLMVITAIIMISMNAQLGLLALFSLPLLIFQAIRFGRIFRPLSMQIQKQLAVVTTRVEQNLRGARVVKTFAQQEAEIERFEVDNRQWFNLSAFAARLQSTNMPLLHLIANLSSVAILWYGGRLVIDNHLTLGELVAFTTYMAQLLVPVRQLGMVLPAITIASASAERVFEILDAVPDVHDSPDADELKMEKGHVRFENVSFSYGKHSSVLKDITFDALPNQVVALLGPTGSGKSTITNLIPRFYDPTAGRITIDGQDLRDVTIKSLRNQIGMVLQETTLFAATIRENITFGRPDATQEEIEAACKAAQAYEFIQQMAHGYDTLVGERGVTLSGGQKQRVAIARALLTNPRILILDDATSSVDSETEHLIQLALEKVMEGRTTFVIAHRLSTVQRADLILVLEKGQIATRGKHEELLKTSALYQSIYHQQLKPKEDSLRGPRNLIFDLKKG